MASFQKRGDKWRAVIRKQVNDGGQKSRSFSSLARAKQWAAERENEITDVREGQIPRKTLGEAFERYSREVSPGKRGGRWEVIRLSALPSTCGGLLKPNTPLQDCSPSLLAQWRDQRLVEVQAGTVLREFGLLSSVFQQCVREWGWMRENPVKAIRKPASPAHRDRLLKSRDLYKILRALQTYGTVSTMSLRVSLAFLFALRTGMRAGEICGIRREHCHSDHVTLPITKNGSNRNVPLSIKAKRLLGKALDLGDELVFGITTGTLDVTFRRCRDMSGVHDVHFHDARHYAATMLARKLTLMELCRMFGWKDPKHALVYYNESPSMIAAKLNAPV